MVIPSMLCFPSFLTISYHFPWCFLMFPLVLLRMHQVFLLFPSVFNPFPYHFPWCFPMFPLFLRFPQMFLLFPLSVSPISSFRFCNKPFINSMYILQNFMNTADTVRDFCQYYRCFLEILMIEWTH